jgi:uroporphyrinogen decarboxylase
MTTPRGNLLRAMRREGFETVPLDSNTFCPDQVAAFEKRFGHKDYHGWFGSPCRLFGIPLAQEFSDWKKYYRHEELPPDTTFSATGVGHSHQPGCFHMTRMHHPLKGEDITAEEIRDYPWPKQSPDAPAKVQARVEELRQQGLASMAGLACTIWEGAWYMRSMEDLMIDMLGDDERATVLLDRVTELSCGSVRIAAQAGADLIQLGDDIGMQSSPMMSVDLWRQWLKPRLAKVINEARNIKPDILVYYHSCGFVLPFLEDLIEVGVDILNPVQPECMKFAEVHTMVGGRMSFWSTIGTQTTLPFGKPEEVKEAVLANLHTCGKAGGIVIGPTHMVEPEVPWENLVAMKEACAEYS